jgi:hypothetical protein
MYKCEILTSGRELYDKHSRTLKWVHRDVSWSGSLTYNHFDITKSQKSRRKYSWFKGDQVAHSLVLRHGFKGKAVKDVTDYVILIKKGRPTTPLFDEVLKND